MRNIINLEAFKLDEKEICQICNKEITSILDSNNARPVSDGRCCRACNADQVIPERIKQLNIGVKNW